MKDLLNRLDKILREIQMDEYLNEETLPKIGEALGLTHQINEIFKINEYRDAQVMETKWVEAISDPKFYRNVKVTSTNNTKEK